jgi:hypothetical protein
MKNFWLDRYKNMVAFGGWKQNYFAFYKDYLNEQYNNFYEKSFSKKDFELEYQNVLNEDNFKFQSNQIIVNSIKIDKYNFTISTTDV